MITSSRAAALAILSLLASSARAGEEPKHPQEQPPVTAKAPDLSNLDQAVAYGTKLLEAKDYEQFFKTFADAEMTAALTRDGKTLAQVAAAVDPEVAQNLIDAFHALKELKPRMEDNDSQAIFTLPEKIVTEKRLSKAEIGFHRIDGHWYLN